jgi:cell division protein FtsW
MAERMKRKTLIRDPILVTLALTATLLGFLFIFDAGYARSLRDAKTAIPREFITQVPAFIVGLLGFWACSRIRPENWLKWSKVLWLGTIGLLVACMLPGIGLELNGAHRWIRIPGVPFMVQPAEFAKLTAVIFLAGALAYRKPWPSKLPARKNIWHWLDTIAVPKLQRAAPFLLVCLGIFLIEIEPDLGTAAVVAAAVGVLLWVGGVSWKSYATLVALTVVAVGALIVKEPYRLERITSHGNRWSAELVDDIAFQTVQSEMAMASGGLTGVGIGQGRAKQVLPATTTDFVMATVAEEWGLFGSLMVLGVLGGIVFRLLYLANQAKDQFQKLVLVGIASWIGIQTCVNMMMANGFMAAIGIPLPFISSGGSSLLALWMAIGVSQAMLRPMAVKEAVVETDTNRRRHRRTHLSRARSRASLR